MAAVKRVKMRNLKQIFAPYVVNLPKTMTVRIVGVNIVAGAPEYITTRGLVPTNFWHIITIQNRSRLSPPDRLVPTNMFDIPASLHHYSGKNN